jgi:signal transduction histidine kinase/putative methionine-R-sulfoxide reductase with GAF domain
MLIAVLSALIFLGLHLALRRWQLPPRYANLLGAAVAGLLLFHRLFSLALVPRPEETTNLILILVGTGFVLLSTPWLLGIIGITMAAWLLIVLTRVADLSAWIPFGLELISTSALTIIIHLVRLRSYHRQESLRLQNERRTKELERQTLQLETLITVGQDINKFLSLDTLLNHMVHLIQERFGYYYVGIFLLDASQTTMLARAGTGEAGRQLVERGFRLVVGEDSLIGWVAQHRQPICVNDVSQDPRYMSTEVMADTRSELVVPLEAGGEFWGALDIQCNQRDAFQTLDVRVFESLGDQVAVAIQNASLYQGEHTRRLLTETLYTISQALSQTLDPQEVLGLILESLLQIVPFDRGSVMLQEGDATNIVAAYGFPPESDPLQISVPIKEGDVFDQLRRLKKPLIVSNVMERPDWHQVQDLPQARAWMGVPLIDARDHVIGMLSLVRETPNPYTEDEGQLAMTFAGQSAVALQNASLYSQLAYAYDQLERLDRTKSDFITVASHELRTPLTVLRAFSQILRQDPQIKEDTTKLQMVEGIAESAMRLHEIVDSMVDMAKIDSRALQIYATDFPVIQLLRTIKSKFRDMLAERNLTLTIDEVGISLTVEADQDLLQKVFHNLVLNAIKYTPDGGHITLAAHIVPPGQRDPEEEGVEIVVSDTGIGIDPRFHDLIFAKFYQTGEVALHSSGRSKFKGGGPGLGLAIAKGIVEAHGGRIWVESPGYDEETCPGSHFHVLLPRRQAQESPSEP